TSSCCPPRLQHLYSTRLCVASFSWTPPPPPLLYTLSLHDALPIYKPQPFGQVMRSGMGRQERLGRPRGGDQDRHEQGKKEQRNRSEEHTSELQSLRHLVCRLLLEKKKQKRKGHEEWIK